MESKSVILTGAAGGLGRAAVGMLTERGVDVICVDRDAGALESAVSGAQIGGRAIPAVADVSSADDIRRCVDLAVAETGRIDGLFLAAGINGDAGEVHTVPDEVFDLVLGVNLKSVWLCLKYALPVMLAGGGGSVVTVGSVAAVRGAPMLGAYAASKHGVVGLTQTVALEYAKRGIRANVLCPGSMDTPLIQPMLHARGDGDPDEGLARTVAGIPDGRLARPGELAKTGVWLLLDAPEHLSGQTIVVDGARTAG
jgi:NAD(P)-dependent dehydrogenase (short-subunit alcohol dehydrogenase family)